MVNSLFNSAITKKRKNRSVLFFHRRHKSTSSGGLNITPDFSIKNLKEKEISLLVLPGGEAWEKHEIIGIESLVEDLNSNNKIIASICSATTFLGEKGFLNKIKHTSNALGYLKNFAPNYKGEENYKSDVTVTDKNIITANGKAPIEFARNLQKIKFT